MTGGGLSLPCPIHKYRGKGIAGSLAICTSWHGFAVPRHVYVRFKSPRSVFVVWVLKVIVMMLFFWWQFYVTKGYLEKVPTEGISRMQLQHPVKKCNPLTQKPGGCETNFKNITSLPYCTQKTNKSVENATRQEKCEYFDEFDIQLPGYQQNSVLIPTRRTKYVQDVNCQGSLLPCPRTDQLKPNETSYVANIEDYTLLIDHSFINDEVNVERKAWDMLGFVNPCGQGATINGQMPLHTYVEGAEKGLDKMNFLDKGEKQEEHECEAEHFEPIHRPDGTLTDKEKEELPKRNTAFAMWMESWDQTIAPFWPFKGKSKDLAKMNEAEITKIRNGDIIKVSDLLDYVEIKLDKVDNTSSPSNTANRYEGIVVIINIHYTNWKQYTWPNKLPPAYFYSFSLAPADEYKLMQNSRAMHLARNDKDHQREIYDYHGIFVIIKQSGCIGHKSWEHIIFLIVAFIFIEGLYRNLLLCLLLNCEMDTGTIIGKKDEDIHELDHVLETEFDLGAEPTNTGFSITSVNTKAATKDQTGYDPLPLSKDEEEQKSPRPTSSREFDCSKGKPCCAVQ